MHPTDATQSSPPSSPWLLGGRIPWNRDATSSGKGKLGSAHLAGPLLMGYPTRNGNQAFAVFSFRALLWKATRHGSRYWYLASAGQDVCTAPAKLKKSSESDEKELGGSQSTYWPSNHSFLWPAQAICKITCLSLCVCVYIYINTSTHTPFKRKK